MYVTASHICHIFILCEAYDNGNKHIYIWQCIKDRSGQVPPSRFLSVLVLVLVFVIVISHSSRFYHHPHYDYYDYYYYYEFSFICRLYDSSCCRALFLSPFVGLISLLFALGSIVAVVVVSSVFLCIVPLFKGTHRTRSFRLCLGFVFFFTSNTKLKVSISIRCPSRPFPRVFVCFFFFVLARKSVDILFFCCVFR